MDLGKSKNLSFLIGENNMSYVLITPVKNEEINLPNLAECIARQTYLPSIWIIVDDNCIDQTPEIIKNLMSRYDWIYSIKKKEINEYGHLSFAVSVKIGYEYAKDICKQKNICYDYVGKIDADILLPENYFQILIDEFKSDLKLGILSGSIIEINETKERKYILDEFADERLYRKEFLEDVRGFPITYSPDTILLIKAKFKGWKFSVVKNLYFHQIRKSYPKDIWVRMKNRGYGRYTLNYHPFLVVLNALYMTLQRPHYHSVAYCYGYLIGVIKRGKKIEDLEIRYYFRYTRWNEMLEKIKSIKKEKKSWFRIKYKIY